MAILSRQDILSANDLKTERVSVPEWGGEVIVRTMDGTQRDEWEASMLDVEGSDVTFSQNGATVNMENARARLVAASLVDEQGVLMFDASDVEALGKKSSAALDRVFEVAQRLSKVTNADIAELTKN